MDDLPSEWVDEFSRNQWTNWIGTGGWFASESVAELARNTQAQVVGYIKGKSAIHIARTFGGRSRNFTGEHFWARGYFASTVGRDEEVIRNYIRSQEREDSRVEQLKLLR